MNIVCGASGISLNFPEDEMYEKYKREREILDVKTYKEIRDKYGIYASNQSMFVNNRSELNEWDGKYMEDLYDKYYG